MKIVWLLSSLLFSISVCFAVPEEAFTFDFNVKMIRMNRDKEEKVYRAIELLRDVVKSAEFKKRILNHKYKGRKIFFQNRGLSNYQIYRKLLAGVEELNPYRNNAMDLELALFTDHSSNVIGYTLPTTRRVWMNTKYFNRYSTIQIAANLFHEWLHKLGFDHDYDRTMRRKYSVPYAIGYIVRDIARRPGIFE